MLKALPALRSGAAQYARAYADHAGSSANLVIAFPVRLARDIITAVGVIADYKWSLRGLEGSQREEAKHACHARGADRLQRLCFANGGIYIKLGQHIVQLDHMLPTEYVKAMRLSMLDKCPVETYAQVARTISEDLGSPPDKLYASFEPVPVASASLAQVHRATGHDGRALAVKVQHAGLRDSFAADAFTVEVLVKAAHWLFPDFNYQWLVEEVKHSLPKELDFNAEAANAARCAANLASPLSSIEPGQVVVPAILPSLSSARVLTMEFVEGYEVTERERMLSEGLQPQEVANIVSRTFNDMIFQFGDVHCDPHAANVFVRKHQGKAQIVTNASSIDHLSLTGSEEERLELQGYAAQFAQQISALLWKVPQEVLLLLKTNDCLRSIDHALGQPVNTFVITARTCSKAISRHRSTVSPGFRSWWLGVRDSISIELRVLAMRVLSCAKYQDIDFHFITIFFD
ncbi:hypothetical protein WJX73_003925 [Symbiochloris irregularis]|uniref:ABC1 atypical kinase-like domain-containing protein n=1 Tax=Symbiochloris irregularis TaxID=706552 RepID=A0AAW1P330_9CHLO